MMRPVLLTDSVTTDLSRAVGFTLLWGLEGVALRTVGKAGDRVPFVDEVRLRARLQEADLPIEVVDPGLFEAATHRRAVWMNDLVVLEEVAAFCKRVGCRRVVCDPLAESGVPYDREAAAAILREAGTIAERLGLRLAVRNTRDTGCTSGEELAVLLALVDHPHIGAAWDPCVAAEAGHDPMAGLTALQAVAASRPAVVIVRDGANESGVWRDQVPGEGTVGWRDHLAALHELDFDGPLVLDVRGQPRPQAGLREATALIQLIREARRNAGS